MSPVEHFLRHAADCQSMAKFSHDAKSSTGMARHGGAMEPLR